MMMFLSLKQSLLSIIGEVVGFIRQDFQLKSYAYTAAVIAGLLIANYQFGLYEKVLLPTYFSGDSWWTMPTFYLAVYFLIAIPVLLMRRAHDVLHDGRFYLKSGFFVTLYGVAVGFYAYAGNTFAGLTASEVVYVKLIISQLKCAAFFVLPLLLLKLTIDRQVNGFYGIALRPKHLNAYFTLFLAMIPFLILTSFTSDFLQAYPQFSPWYFEGIFGMRTWAYTLLYELAYAFDFVMVELIFRGALVVGLMALMGRSAVLPMVAMYCAIHFGKPVVESISSVFGGYILGVLAYRTSHIWGGIMVHICIALTMEVMGFVHYYILKNEA